MGKMIPIPEAFHALRDSGIYQWQMAEKLGVSVRTVENWLRRLRRHEPEADRAWTAQEDAILKDYRQRNVRIGKIVIRGRTRREVEVRIRHLGLNKRANEWSPERDAELARLYQNPTLSIPNIAKRLGVSEASARCRAIKIGLRKATIESWSKEDADQLRNLWAKHGPAEIARITGRTESAVHQKAKRMRLPTKAYPTSRKPADRDYESVAAAARARARIAKPRPRLVSVENMDVIPEGTKPWMERRFGECNYPHGPRGNIHSCCKPVFAGKTMCEGHLAICYQYERKAA